MKLKVQKGKLSDQMQKSFEVIKGIMSQGPTTWLKDTKRTQPEMQQQTYTVDKG